MLTILGGIAILGILVFVHELGHFGVAKFCGVKVLKFSLGFGPRLVSRQWGETEYMICAIPLGGYVLMLGEGSGEDGETAELTPEEEARSFAKQSVGVRTAIIAAGPLMNLLLPFVVLPLAYMLGVQTPAYLEQKPCVGYVVSDSIAARAGAAAGDCIVAVNGVAVDNWETANNTLVAQVGKALTLRVMRDGTERDLQLSEGGIDGLLGLGLLPTQDAVVGSVSAGMPAAAAGIQVGDRITAIDQQLISSWYDLKETIRLSGGKPLTFAIERTDGSTVTITLTPQVDKNEPLIGITPQHQTVNKQYGVIAATQAGWHRAIELIDLTWLFIIKLFTGHVSTSNIGGPISVVQLAGQATQTDVASVFLVLAFLSIQLGILNLLPIPILDGGHLFFNVMELTMRRPLSLRAREIAQQIGLVLLLLLMLLAFYNDISRILGG